MAARADQTGAMRTLARTPIGKPLLVVAAVALAALAVWMLVEAMSTCPRAAADRLKLVGLRAGVRRPRVDQRSRAARRGSFQWQQSRSFTADVPTHTGGKVVIVAIGLGVIVIGGYHVVKGVKKTSSTTSPAIPAGGPSSPDRSATAPRGSRSRWSASCSSPPAVRSKPSEAGGLDAALRTLLGQPFGAVLLVAVALGLACYAVYSFVRAKYGRL